MPLQLSEAPLTHNTLHHRFFRGGHLASHVEHDINPAIYETGYNSFSFPILDLSIYSNPHNYIMEPLSREELERFQKLSNDYEPEVQVRISRWVVILVVPIADHLFVVIGSIGLIKAVQSSYLCGVFQCRPDIRYQDQCRWPLTSRYDKPKPLPLKQRPI